MPQWQTFHYSGEGRGRGCSELGPSRGGVQVPCHLGSLSPARLLQAGRGPRPRTHEAEAAADAGLHVAAPERCHLPQLARDLDGLVEQDAEVPLVTQSPGVGHLAEEICGQDRHAADTPAPQQQAGTGEQCVGHTRDPTDCLQQGAQIRGKN